VRGWCGTAAALGRLAKAVAAAFATLATVGALTKAAGGSDSLAITFGAVGVVGAVVSLALGVLQVRAEASEEEAKLWRGSPRPVRDALMNDGMYRLGVETEAPEALLTAGLARQSHAPYLPRPAVDAKLRAALVEAAERPGATLVVLSGPAKSGKSRTLLEALHATLPDAWLIEPDSSAALVTLARMGPPRTGVRPWVLWLDDLEWYVGHGHAGLNAKTLPFLDQWRLPVIVVAAYGGKCHTRAVVEGLADPVADLLRLGQVFDLVSWHSAQERESLTAHPQYGSVAERIAREGIAEFMIVATELRRRLTVDVSCPEGLAVTQAVIDWQRCGLLRPVPETDVEELFRTYLAGPPSTDRLHKGLAWAEHPVYSHVSLLAREDAGVSPYDFAVRVEDERERPIPLATWLKVSELCATTEEWQEVVRSAMARREEVAADAICERDDDRGDGIASWFRGMRLRHRGDLADAESAFQRAEARGVPPGACALGEMLRARGDLAEAEAAYRRAYEAGSSDAATEVGLILLDRGDLAGAEAAFRRADEWNNEVFGGAEGTLRLGMLLAERGDEAAAEVAFRRADERGDAHAAHNLGVRMRETGDRDAAESAFRRAEERGLAEGAAQLGDLLIERGDVDEAEAAYRRADEQGSAVGAFNVGALALASGDGDSALAAFRRAGLRGMAAGDVQAGALLADAGDLEAAEAAYRRAGESGLAGVAAMRLQQGDLDAAEDASRRADGLGDPDGSNNLGVVLLRRGDRSGAEEAFRRADERGHTDGAHNLGILLDERGDTTGVKAAFRRADQRNRPDANAASGVLSNGQDAD
jgi:tetratricopeptide (TPR) repeat protein